MTTVLMKYDKQELISRPKDNKIIPSEWVLNQKYETSDS